MAEITPPSTPPQPVMEPQFSEVVGPLGKFTHKKIGLRMGLGLGYGTEECMFTTLDLLPTKWPLVRTPIDKVLYGLYPNLQYRMTQLQTGRPEHDLSLGFRNQFFDFNALAVYINILGGIKFSTRADPLFLFQMEVGAEWAFHEDLTLKSVLYGYQNEIAPEGPDGGTYNGYLGLTYEF